MYRMRKEIEMFMHVVRNLAYSCMDNLFFNVCYTASHLKMGINLDIKKTNIILEFFNDFFEFNVKKKSIFFLFVFVFCIELNNIWNNSRI